jgi:protein-S-isoprenylcysteine O-methyltransferase Ste14
VRGRPARDETEAGVSIAALVKNITLWLLGAAVVWFFAVSVPVHIGDWDSGPFPLPVGAISLLGWVPMILGGCTIIWCYSLFFLVGKGTPWPFDPPKRLVVSGPYRFVRNPMEGSFVVILLGEAVLFRSIMVLFYALVGLALLHAREALVEEPGLRKRFGESYEKYRNSVPLWIPRLTPYKGERSGPPNPSLEPTPRSGPNGRKTP